MVSVGQERMDELDSDKTVFQEISEGLDDIELGTQTVMSRAYLSWFGFKGQSQQSKVRTGAAMVFAFFMFESMLACSRFGLT